jgi:hypothetical protein
LNFKNGAVGSSDEGYSSLNKFTITLFNVLYLAHHVVGGVCKTFLQQLSGLFTDSSLLITTFGLGGIVVIVGVTDIVLLVPEFRVFLLAAIGVVESHGGVVDGGLVHDFVGFQAGDVGLKVADDLGDLVDEGVEGCNGSSFVVVLQLQGVLKSPLKSVDQLKDTSNLALVCLWTSSDLHKALQDWRHAWCHLSHSLNVRRYLHKYWSLLQEGASSVSGVHLGDECGRIVTRLQSCLVLEDTEVVLLLLRLALALGISLLTLAVGQVGPCDFKICLGLVEQWDVVVKICLRDTSILLRLRNLRRVVSKRCLTLRLSCRVLSIMISLLLPNSSVKGPDEVNNLINTSLQFHLELDCLRQSLSKR